MTRRRSVSRVVCLASMLMMLIGLTLISTNAAGGPVEVEFWHYYQDQTTLPVIEKACTAYNKEHPEVKIKPIFVPTDQIRDRLQAAIMGKNPPAMVVEDICRTGLYAATGTLLPLDQYLAAKGVKMEDFYPGLITGARYNGQTVAMPISTNNLALFYNKNLFKAAGLDPNKPPKTWDDLLRYAKKMTKPDGSVYGFEMYSQVDVSGEGLSWNLQPYFWQAGADFLDPTFTRAAFNNPAGEKALQFVVDLFQKHKVAGLARKDSFGRGEAAMVVNGPWMIGIWKDLEFPIGTAFIPYPKGGKPATNMGGEQIFLFKTNSAIEQAAADFVIWFTSPEQQLNWSKQTGMLPVRYSVAQSPKYRAFVENTQPLLLPFIDQQQYAHARPPIPEYADCSLAFARVMEKAYYGKITIKQALAEAAQAIDTILKK